MRKLWIQAVAIDVVLFVLLLSCAAPQRVRTDRLPEEKNRPSIEIARLEKTIHILINNERRQHGLEAVLWDDALSAIARKHSRDMS